MPDAATATALDLARIQDPPARLRGTPFWSWNHDVTDHRALREQLDALAEMGMGGAHVHSRIGLRTPYLSADWFDAVRAARDHAHGKGMLTWLYDEDAWPSGYAGGLVGREPRWRQRWLTVADHPPVAGADRESAASGAPTTGAECRPLGCWRVALDEDGHLLSAEPIPEAEAEAGAGDWWAWVQVAPDSSRFNGGAYIDTLNPAAVDAFIASTHERYLEAFGGAFPADVPAIFTDEPQYAARRALGDPRSGEFRVPWTDDLIDSYRAATGEDLFALIPELVWTRREGPSAARWRFWDHVTERFASAFADRIGAWCEAHGIMLTGHMMNEPTLGSQLGSIGEAMRHYRGFQLPGIDMLCDRDELTTAKQATSITRQDAREGVLSELYGVTDWDFPFAGHKRQGDWQAALGVTVRVHHLTWLSMAGDAKRDYPASIGPHMPWYREYRVIEDHFARVGAALTQGSAKVRIAVVHPIESAWLRSGPGATDGVAAGDLDARFGGLTEWLVGAQLDFDYLCEAELPRQLGGVVDGALRVGAMRYDAVVVPGVETLRGTTLDALRAVLDGGGAVLVCGEEPSRVDGEPASPRVAAALDGATRVAWTQAAILEALEPWRELEVRRGGGRHGGALYQLRELENGERICFLCDRRRGDPDASHRGGGTPGNATIRLRGAWRVAEIDTASGERSELAVRQGEGWTELPWDAHPASHRLLHLVPGAVTAAAAPAEACSYQPATGLGLPTALERDEPNVLPLTRAEWALDDEPWQQRQDVMHIQQALIRRFDWPHWCQPWVVEDPGAEHRLRLRFPVHCAASLRGARLALERAAETTIRIDGQTLDASAEGWWVDRCFELVALPELAAGEHVIELEQPVDALRRPEWSWLLLDQPVAVRGEEAVVAAPADAPPNWGDLVHQGLPCYAGNLTYRVPLTIAQPGCYALRLPRIGGALARVALDGADRGVVYRVPWRCELGTLDAGEHELAITVFGTRRNAFGALHNDVPGWSWWGPAAWTVADAQHNACWQLRPIGLLRAPILERVG